MAEKHFDIPEEPSVTSEDPNERKLARRLRIKRRLEAQKKHERLEDEGSVEATLTEKRIEASADILEKLIAEGDEVVSNVRIANDAREVHRREDDIAIRKNLLQKLEDEANESLRKYHAINEKWSGILSSKDPLDIHDGIQSQNAKCLEILEQKDIIIAELKQELENSDEKFMLDQKKQNEDINLLIERIENQVNTIAKAYRRELVLIEKALKSERNTLLESVAKRWDLLYKQRQDQDMDGVKQRKQIMQDYEIEKQKVLMEHQEEYRAQKIELETECQNLQQEVERMKAMCMMNVEKLDYSYTVLKRREDENTIIKNQQKRRINKLQDVINGLRKTYMELEENSRLEIQKLSELVMKAHKSISELETKSNHFTLINEKQYFDIWEMNTRNANELVEKILTADKIIHEQTLGLDWEPPEQPLLKKDDLPSYRRAMSGLQERKADAEASMKIFETSQTSKRLDTINLERRLLNHILKLISDHSGFLIEDKLRELLSSHTSNDNIIIRLENVFQALSIKSEDQVDLLIDFFLPYSYCVTCSEDEDGESFSEESSMTKLGNQEDKHESLDDDTGNSRDQSLPSNDDTTTELPRNLDSQITSVPEQFSENVSLSPQRTVTCKKGHLLEIEAVNVIKALKEFVEKYDTKHRSRIPSFHDKLLNNNVTLSRSLTTEDITNYWKRYREIFSTKKEKLWDGLLIGLHKYHDILKERHRLNNETECLRRQNEELKRLLETYMVKPGSTLMSVGPRSSNRTA